MNRRFGWAMLMAAGILLGCTLSFYQKTNAEPPASAAADAVERNADAAAQLKEIKIQLKEINTLLHDGTIKVVVVLNPEKP